MKSFLALLGLILLFSACSQEKKSLRHAANAIERANYDKAISNYDEILKKNKNSFFGNAGKGIVLSEYMGRHEQAIPYLETALKNTPEKTKAILQNNLGKSYHFVGNYKRALYYYSKSQKDNNPKWADYDEFLSKRIADCRYAIEHPRVALPENQQLTNLGKTVNTAYPEYTPVATQTQLFFTSKRPDSPKEKRNGQDGKYFEAIYKADLQKDGSFELPERYIISKSGKSGEAILSASPDGQKLFVFRNGQLFESDIKDSTHALQKMDNTVNFGYLQNHASLSPDGKTLYFISESEKGHGGTDIFVSNKKLDGSWGEPKMLDYTINSEFDEEAPFVNEAGTLFFSSNGHPGYGGFDVYKSSFVNGAWTKPENLGQPINSAGDDIYFVLKPNSSKGYFASARPGGFGDLDIYKVHYVTSDVSPCIQDPQLVIEARRDLDNPMAQLFKLYVPQKYKATIRSYRWKINGQELSETTSELRHTFTKADNYAVQAQILMYCDSCPNMQARCTTKEVVIEAPQILTSTFKQPSEKSLSRRFEKKNKTSTKNIPALETSVVSAEAALSSGTAQKSNSAITDNPAQTEKNTGPSASDSAELYDEDNFISAEELSAYDWLAVPSKFDYNKTNITVESKKNLDHNILILKSHPEFIIRIVGHADSRGTEAYNQDLSLRRAQAVKSYLIHHGLPASRIIAVRGKGEKELLNTCSTDSACPEEQHAVNRRVQLQVRSTGNY